MSEMGAHATSDLCAGHLGCPAGAERSTTRQRIELEKAQKISRGEDSKNLKGFGPG